MIDKKELREISLKKKREKRLTWEEIGKYLGKDKVYAAMLLYGYAQATEEEADKIITLLDLPKEFKPVLLDAPMRTPAQPWPPTDPFIYRLYEGVLLYGPVIKDVAHELFGDGIMSMIDVKIYVDKVIENNYPRMLLTFNGKWLYYSKW
ncbi:cyanase [Sulfurisphaera ohwakuensis]|uniref:Cyanate hydratase n=1 Tax=Sulfurisphaera ohwakuensis TaxID=69656 RepID=A0A650CG31_SULOH|nr:cyanase [Sulfurisphaera ohwakuensis]MBB5254931.1 cyanate lyase [Sulfurisphaera ohwakuensis]QGR16772.1 cyanase [Sulfurisphaera ohwakuensis]